MRRHFITSLSILLLLTNAARANDIIFSRLSINDGLNSNLINCVWQDYKGLLWVGTQIGLQRFDGYKFTDIYSQTKDHSLPALPVNQIMGDKSHHMWLRLGKIIGRYNFKTNRFIKANTGALPDGNYSLWINKAGQVLINGFEKGVYLFDAKTNAFKPWALLNKVPKDWGILSVCEDEETGNYWVCGKKGLGMFDTARNQFYYEGNNPLHIPLLDFKIGGYVLGMFIDSKRRYWFVKWPPTDAQTLNCYDEQTHKITIKQPPVKFNSYYELVGINEHQHQIWLYGNPVLSLFNENTQEFYRFYENGRSTDQIKFNSIRQVVDDADKNIWIATDNGLYHCNLIGNQIKHGNLPAGNGDIEFAKQITNGRLIIGNWGGGLFTYPSQNSTPLVLDSAYSKRLYKGVPKDYSAFMAVWDMIEYSGNHHLYFGCQGGRLIDYDPVTRHSTFLIDSLNFKNSTIRSIAEDHQHNLWFGSQSGKFVKRTPDGKYRFYGDFGTLILKIVTDTRGLLWICTASKGIAIYNPQTGKLVKRYTADHKDPSQNLTNNSVRQVVQVNDSIFAVACTEGLDLLNIKTGKVKKFDVYNGLPQPLVNCLQLDKKGNLWLATSNGIARYSFKTNSFSVYDQKDGLITTTSSDDELRKCSMLKNGDLVFAGGNTFIIFNPDAFNEAAPPKDVTITDVRVINNDINIDAIGPQGLQLDHEQNAITIQFAALNYAQRNKLKYYYMLKGSGDDWVKAESGLSASFASLSPGHYIFMVKCTSQNGLASKHITSLAIYIKPAFWQTWWFVVLMFLLAGVPFYVINQYRIKRLLAVQKLREKVARDLHDDMGSTLTSIHILSEMAGVKIKGENEQVKDYLGRISSNSSQMMDAMDDIVWSINPAHDTMPKIIARMREYAATVLEPQDINYTVVNDDKLRNIKLDMDVRRNLFLIFKETLNNLVKYSGAKNVLIEFKTSRSKLEMLITDDGIGFDLNNAQNGNGLTNMQKRADNMRGSLQIKTQKNAGTRITLQLPVT